MIRGLAYGIVLYFQFESLWWKLPTIISNLSSRGSLLGSTIAYLILTQFIVMSRVRPLERIFWYLNLVHFHKILGYIILGMMLIHPVLFIFFYSNILSQSGFESLQLLLQTPRNIWWWVALLILLVTIVLTVHQIRKRLYYESWYFTHLLVYSALVFVGLHHFSRLSGYELYFRWVLYGATILSVIYYRLLLPRITYHRHNRTITKITPDTATSNSFLISGKNISRLSIQGWQFIKIRVLTRGFWRQSHPFSLSRLPEPDSLRLTLKQVGNYTTNLAKLPIGTKVLIDGPFGKFVNQVATTDKRLYIAGGIGITPLIWLIQESLQAGHDTILLYANQKPDNVPLLDDIHKLKSQWLQLYQIFSREEVSWVDHGRITLHYIQDKIADYTDRDIYICGPQAMIHDLSKGLKQSWFPRQQLHYEVFNY